MRRFRTWLRKPGTHRNLAILGVAIGASSTRFLFEDLKVRVDELENAASTGLVPREDFVTVGELDRRLAELPIVVEPNERRPD